MWWDKYNIRQRGIGNPNPVKLGRCIKELERIYDIHQGNGSNQYEQNPKLSDKANMAQSDIAEMIGISVDTLNNYKNSFIRLSATLTNSDSIFIIKVINNLL